MMSLNASGIELDMLPEAEADDVVPEWWGSKVCRVPGCGKPTNTAHGTNGWRGRDGYCGRHWDNVERCGHPFGEKYLTRDALFEAAHAYGDRPDAERRRLLALAVCDYAAVRYSAPMAAHRRFQAPSLAEEHMRSPQGIALIEATWAFTDHGTEPTDDLDFTFAVGRLEEAAVGFYRTLPVIEPKPIVILFDASPHEVKPAVMLEVA